MRRPLNCICTTFAIAVIGLFGCDGQSTQHNVELEDAVMTTAPYGTWQSPVSAELTAGSANGIIGLQLHEGDLYWLESRPLEGGRYVLMQHADSGPIEITPAEYNVRTRVHEYGGTPFLVANDSVYFSNFSDQALYAQKIGAEPERLSQSDGLRYADCAHDPVHNRLLCVREDHREDGEAINSLVAVALHGTPNDGEVLWQESDFVGYPRINASGSQMAWISWDHPNMPWDNVALWVADIGTDGQIQSQRQINAGTLESVLQPTWAEDDTLYFLTDRSGWWNMHSFADGSIKPIHQVDAELGGPLWSLGIDYFALVANRTALVDVADATGSGLALLDLESGELDRLTLPHVAFGALQASSDTAYFIGGQNDGPSQVVAVQLEDHSPTILHQTGDRVVAEEFLSVAQPITFTTAGGNPSYGYYYPPKNADFDAPTGELPPLMVLMHGGPTGATSAQFSIAKQFWTSRGIAIVDVNYRGSTGYGRQYRQQLNGQWGIVDLEDAVAATEYLVAQGKADPDRLLIRGGSAGGFTTLSALAFTDVFAAGANYFGVSDLMALAEHTHKFESRYLDSMIGPYPEAAEVYAARSPINTLEGFNSPLITFQGLEDKVVPPAQSEKIYQALKEKGTPTAYIPFEGEQHGFRKAENNITALESELYFYGKVLGFEPYGDLPQIQIDNLIE